MAESRKDSLVPGTSPTSIKMDLLHFKDDILKDIRTVQLSLDDKYIKADEFLRQRITKFELKINSFEKKISELSNLIITDTSIREKVDSLMQSEEEIRDTIFKRRAIFNEFEKKTKDDINRLSNIITDSVIYPGIIGNTCKFKTFHEFMDYVLKEIAQLVIFKDKSGLDLTPFKRKIDTVLDNLKLQMNNFCSKDFLNTSLSQSEEKIQSLLKIYDDRLQDTRVENSHYAVGLKKKAEDIIKQMDKLKKYQNQLLEAKEKEEIFNNLNNDIFQMKIKINKMNEIIKELLSYHPATKKAFMGDFEKKSSKIYSGVKQYIKGNLNANELSSMRKFTVEKSKSKPFEYSPNTTPFPSPDTMKFSIENQRANNKARDNNGIIDKRKMFQSQKSLKIMRKDTDVLDEKINEQDIKTISINNNGKKEKKKVFFRRKTCNYDNIPSFEPSKLNNELNKDMRSSYKVTFKNKIKEIEDDSELENDEEESKNIANDNKKVSNFIDSTPENDNNKDKNDISQKSIKNNSKDQKNQSIIKEEDENAMSDHSTKNFEVLNSIRNLKGNGENKEEVKLVSRNKNMDNIVKSIVNEEKKIKDEINAINSVNDKNAKIDHFKDKIDKYNSQNDIKLVSIKRKTHLNEDKKIINSIENTNSVDINQIDNYNDNNFNQTDSNLMDFKINNEETKENINKKKLINNSSFPKVYSLKKNYNSIDNKKKSPIIDIQNLNNLAAINSSINKTYTNFPRIKKDLSENKILSNNHKNNFIEKKNMDIICKTLSVMRSPNQAPVKVAAYENKKPKKVLLINPDDIPPNSVMRITNKNINKNKSVGIQSEKSNKVTKMENLYNNHQVHLYLQLDSKN